MSDDSHGNRIVWFKFGLSERCVHELGQALINLDADYEIQPGSEAHSALGVLVEALNDADPRE